MGEELGWGLSWQLGLCLCGMVLKDLAMWKPEWSWMLGGLEHLDYVSIIYWEYHHPNWRSHIFQRGRCTTNQIVSFINGLLMVTSEWLVVDSNYSGWWFQTCVYFSFHIWDIIIPIDKLIFFKMVIAPPTRHWDSWTIDSWTATLVGDILWFLFSIGRSSYFSWHRNSEWVNFHHTASGPSARLLIFRAMPSMIRYKVVPPWPQKRVQLGAT